MSAPQGPVVGLVLAAGASRRMGPGRNKLVEQVHGRPVVASVVAALLEAELDRVVVVLGHEAERVRAALDGCAVTFVEHVGWASGMGSSLAAGVAGTLASGAPEPGGFAVTVGDLPDLRAEDVAAVVRGTGREWSASSIRVPTHAGHDGHPVLFGRAYDAALRSLEGDRGARAVLEANAGDVERVPIDHAGILRDVDTPEALEAARRH